MVVEHPGRSFEFKFNYESPPNYEKYKALQYHNKFSNSKTTSAIVLAFGIFLFCVGFVDMTVVCGSKTFIIVGCALVLVSLFGIGVLDYFEKSYLCKKREKLNITNENIELFDEQRRIKWKDAIVQQLIEFIEEKNNSTPGLNLSCEYREIRGEVFIKFLFLDKHITHTHHYNCVYEPLQVFDYDTFRESYT